MAFEILSYEDEANFDLRGLGRYCKLSLDDGFLATELSVRGRATIHVLILQTPLHSELQVHEEERTRLNSALIAAEEIGLDFGAIFP